MQVYLYKYLTNSLVADILYYKFPLQPEKISGMDYTIQSEVWSLGISLFEVINTYLAFR